MACLAIVRELLTRHTKLRGLLVRTHGRAFSRRSADCSPSHPSSQENETGAAGVYLPDATEPEGACALSSCLWELTLLAEHAHAHVASISSQVASMPLDDVPPPPLYGTASPEVSLCTSPHRRTNWANMSCLAQDLLRRYTTVGGSFHPAPPRRPNQRNGRRHSCPPAKVPSPVGGTTEATAQHFAAHFQEAREFRRNFFLREAVRRLKASGAV